jgi:hypothetical protein
MNRPPSDARAPALPDGFGRIDLQVSGEPSPLRPPLAAEVINPEGEIAVECLVHAGRHSTVDVRAGHHLVRAYLPSGGLLSRQAPVTAASVTPVELPAWATEPRHAGDVGADPGSVWLRMWSWQDERWQPQPWPLSPVSTRDGDLHVTVTAPPGQVSMLQVGGDQLPWRLVCLPPGTATAVIRPATPGHEDGVTIATRVLAHNQVVESLAGYLRIGQLRAARIIALALAGELRRRSPMGAGDLLPAVVCSYALLRMHMARTILGWVEDLDDRGAWLPDVHVIRAAALLEVSGTSQRQQARDRLLLAAASALPVYSEGFRLLVQALDLLAHDRDDHAVDQARSRLRPYAVGADWSSPLVGFLGNDPSSPSPMPLTGMPLDADASVLFLYGRAAPAAPVARLVVRPTGRPSPALAAEDAVVVTRGIGRHQDFLIELAATPEARGGEPEVRVRVRMGPDDALVYQLDGPPLRYRPTGRRLPTEPDDELIELQVEPGQDLTQHLAATLELLE